MSNREISLDEAKQADGVWEDTPDAWRRKEDSPLYKDLSGLNAESDEFGIITTYPMHRVFHGHSSRSAIVHLLVGAAKCKVIGHAVAGLESDNKCGECGRTRKELEMTGQIWDGKSAIAVGK
jgi:hypothetical protein